MKVKEYKTISHKNLPTKLPLYHTGVVWLLLDRFNASDLVHGIVWTIMSIIWITSIALVIKENKVDIFKSKDDENI